VKTERGHPVLALNQLDSQAIVALLIEREVALLTAFNVETA